MSEAMTGEDKTSRAPLWTAPARGLALFLGLFSAVNCIGGLRVRGFDANLWWVDLRGLPAGVATALIWAAAFLLVAFALRPRSGRWRFALTVLVVALLAVVALANSLQFLRILRAGEVRAGFPVPLSALTLASLLWILAGLVRLRGASPHRYGHALLSLAVFCAALLGFPLLQMFCFGKTDYRRPADVVVVFGARAYSDGRPSHALADRVRTGCHLLLDGLAPKVVFSGGPGDGDVHETEAMRRCAVSLGVPDDAILLDPEGLSTDRTVQNTTRLFQESGLRRVLAVSHFYHLPRVKLRYQRAGIDVFTVPAEERYTLTALPYLMCREIAALWYYYWGAMVSP